MNTPKHKSRKRHEDPNHARLINFACYNNQPFLKSDRACKCLADAIIRAREKHQFRLWAYAFMPDHVHLLIWPRTPIPPVLTSIKKSTANRAIHWAKNHRPSTLPRMIHTSPNGNTSFRFWQRGGGYDRNLWTPQHIWNAINYIHMNPVVAKLCDKPADWPWSSAASHTARNPDPIPLDFDSLPPKP